jgi:hypothetical protein
MKNIIMLIACLVAFSAKSAEVQCETTLRYRAVYYNKCPRGLVVTGTDVRISGNPSFPVITTFVECAELIINCSKTKEKLNGKTSKTSNNY